MKKPTAGKFVLYAYVNDAAEILKVLRGLYDAQPRPPLLCAKDWRAWIKAMNKAEKILDRYGG